MDRSRMSDVDGKRSTDSSSSVIMDSREGGAGGAESDVTRMRSPLSKTRSLSDGGGTPKSVSKLSPSPFIIEAASRRESKDDITIRDKESTTTTTVSSVPSTPIRTGFHLRNLSLQMPSSHQQQQHHLQPPPPHYHQQSHQQSAAAAYVRQAPLSPKLDHSHIYASPTNILPRRSRGLDFSRAATSLHHSTLADPAEPDSSPTIGSRAMNIPGRRNVADYAGGPSGDHPPVHNPSSLWGIMGSQERMQVSSSIGSTNHVLCDSSSSASDDDDMMDEDMDEAYITTPQAPGRISASGSGMNAPPWVIGSPAVNSLLSFQQRQRQRKQPKKKMRGPLGLGFHSPAAASGAISKSPPSTLPHSRRESISWAANQLHISGHESDSGQVDGVDSPSRPSVVRRAVTRRGNLLPKTKGFARIRAALLEESAPLETEIRSEAEVVRQVRESDMDLEPRLPPPAYSTATTTALSSPNLDMQSLDNMMAEDAMMIESAAPPASSTSFLSGTFKQQVMRNSKGKTFWDKFPETGRTTPPPPPPGFFNNNPRGSMDDVSMVSPSTSSQSQSNNGGNNNPFAVPSHITTSSSSGNGTPQPPLLGGSNIIPSAADITRRINSKRRRGDDEFDPISIKRRAVSPGMSAHNSPIMQSPLQRDSNNFPPWGANGGGGGSSGSRPGSVSGGDSRSENGSGGSGNAERGGTATATAGGSGRPPGGPGKVRVGFQGMVDTNDGITRLSIE
ncbi:hypothetical protein QBC38DRAFT_371573 [Podospora fimiseda]|uniref:Uncharacterized protein n=1 Tax=Podospora fimiseda TaxID=252190 RepID=A0AAN7GWY1_9PEZI|nr:hypothetical protein QBC38DRAFT_371573 [Podospora fimiseda]